MDLCFGGDKEKEEWGETVGGLGFLYGVIKMRLNCMVVKVVQVCTYPGNCQTSHVKGRIFRFLNYISISKHVLSQREHPAEDVTWTLVDVYTIDTVQFSTRSISMQ